MCTTDNENVGLSPMIPTNDPHRNLEFWGHLGEDNIIENMGYWEERVGGFHKGAEADLQDWRRWPKLGLR